MTLSEQPITAAAPVPPAVPPERRRGLRVAVAVVLLLAVVVVGYLAVDVLGESQPRRSGTNAVFPSEPIVTLKARERACQLARVPAGTGALEIPLENRALGRGLSLSVLDGGGRVVARAGAPVLRAGTNRFELPRPLAGDVEGRVCLAQAGGSRSSLIGSQNGTGLEVDGGIVPGGVSIAYYRPGRESLISMVPVIAQRIGMIRGRFGGSGRAVVIALSFAAGLGLALWLFIGLARGRARRRAAIVCTAVAVLNAFAWSLLTPTFQIPDEHYHLSYVQDLAEHGKPPDGGPERMSDELNLIVAGSGAGAVNFNPFGRPPWSKQQNAEFNHQLATRKLSTDNPGANGNVKDYPPAYYASMVPIYVATHAAGGSTLDAITLIRAAGALLAGITILALFAFLTELFPSRRLLAAGVALICAYQPVFTWISGGVNPDALLIALGAVMFWLFARASQRGLDQRLAIGLGLVFAAAVLTKVSAIGFAPGWGIGMLLLLWRRRPERPWRTAIAAALAAGVPLLLYTLANALIWDRSLLPSGVSAAAHEPSGEQARTASGFVSYLWQYFLPKIGGMTDFLGVGWAPRDFWTPLWVGKFGWFDYQFPDRVNHLMFVVYCVIAIAALVSFVPQRKRLGMPMLIYVLLAGGLLIAIARAAYPLRVAGNFIFEQARYLMPLIGLYALALALAASPLRRRFEVAVLGVFLAGSVVLLLAAWELTIKRYYL